MDRKLGGLALLLFAGSALGQGAPFCVVYSGGHMCNYYDASACRRAAQGMNGMCAANSPPTTAQPARPPVNRDFYDVTERMQMPDVVGTMQRGMSEGQRRRIERDEHQVRMALLQAQTEAARSQSSAAIAPPTAQPERYVGVSAQPDDARTAKSLADGCAVANSILDGTADTKYGAHGADERFISVGICYGYIDGFLQGFSAGRKAPQSLEACIPSGVSTGQIARLVEDRMKKMPEHEHMDRLPFLMVVTAGAWPCKAP